MSQRFYPAPYQGRAVTILIGWDRPLQGYFMVIKDPADACGYLYSNLEDEDLLDSQGMSSSVGYFEGKLAEFGLGLPESILSVLELDAVFNTGNVVAHYDMSGQRLDFACVA